MTRRFLTAAAWLASVTALAAQTPPGGQPPLGEPTPPAVAPPAAAPAVTAEVWQHLQNWEAVMKTAQNFYCTGTKSIEHKAGARKGIRNYTIDIMCLMPSKSRMNITAVPAPGQKPDPNDYSAYIATENVILEYEGLDKRLTETRLAPGSAKGQLLLDFLSGSITAQAAIDRFAITMRQQDANYIYLELKPKTKQDLEDFETMILVLFRDMPGQAAYLPAQVVLFTNNNQIEETWNFKSPAINIKGVKPEYFEPVAVDAKTWTTVVQNARPRGNNPPPGMPATAVPGPGGRPVVPTPGSPPK